MLVGAKDLIEDPNLLANGNPFGKHLQHLAVRTCKPERDRGQAVVSAFMSVAEEQMNRDIRMIAQCDPEFSAQSSSVEFYGQRFADASLLPKQAGRWENATADKDH